MIALVSYLRSVPPVDRSHEPGHVGVLGKVLDRLDMLPLDVARRIDHGAARPQSLEPRSRPPSTAPNIGCCARAATARR